MLTSIPIHTLSVTGIQDFIINKIKSLIKNFPWQHNLHSIRLHLNKWDTITTSKDNGGDIRSFKYTLQASRISRYLNKNRSLWSNIMHTKYGTVHF